MLKAETTPKTVNQQLLDQLRIRLEEVDTEAVIENEETPSDNKNLSGVKGLLGFFQEKFSTDPEYAYVEDDRPSLYDLFEESIQKSLIATKRTRVYDDFAEITVLYFIRDADRAHYDVEEIDDFLKMI